MAASIENIQKFQKALGALAMEFSKLEFALIYYCALIDNPSNYSNQIKVYLGSTLEVKRSKIKSFIYQNLTGLKAEWDIINSKIGAINDERRHLIHGIGRSYFLLDAIKTVIKKGDGVVSKEYTVEDINKVCDQLSHLLTGNNGLEGEFLEKFTTELFDYLNEKEENGIKLVYRVNDKILTKWKG